MDPEANYAEQLRIAEMIDGDNGWGLDDARRLAELVLALHGWVEKGGFPPAVFTPQK